jgi:hypothetical protein
MGSLDALNSIVNFNNRPMNPTGRGFGDRNGAKIGALRKMLGMEGPDLGEFSQGDYEAAGDYVQSQALERETAPERVRGEYGLAGERIRGEYGLKGAELEGEIAGQRLGQQYQMNREDNDARTAQVLAGITGRQQLQDDQQQFKAGQIPPSVLSQIAREEQALRQKAGDPKLQPGLLSKLPVIGKAFTPKNPYQEQLDAFTGARQFAQRVYQQYPGMSAEDIAALEGENELTPQELQLVNRFLMQFRGR